MALSSDPYEQKLYHMFQSHGTGDGSDDDASSGLGLDRNALLKLCQTLELKERGHLLVKCLLIGSKTHVSFREFREGLLHILGGNEEPIPVGVVESEDTFPASRSQSNTTFEPQAKDSDHSVQQLQNNDSSTNHGCQTLPGSHSSAAFVSTSLAKPSSSIGGNETENTSDCQLLSSSISKNITLQENVLKAEQQEPIENVENGSEDHCSLIGHAKPQSSGMATTRGTKFNGVPVDEIDFSNQRCRVKQDRCQRRFSMKKKETEIVEESTSDREVSPKFVVGTKKYGRRSRPREDIHELDSLSSNSDNETTNISKVELTINSAAEQFNGKSHNHRLTCTEEAILSTNKVQRSVSQSDIHGSKRRRPITISGVVPRLKRCASLPTHRQRPTIAISNDKRNITTPVTICDQLHMDNEALDQKIYFMHLSENLREIWNSLLQRDCDFSSSLDGSEGLLNQTELEVVCERVGLQKDPARLAAQEVFKKLSLQPNEGINFGEFIALLESNTELLSISEIHELNSGAEACGESRLAQHQIASTSSEEAVENNTFILAMPLDWTSEIGSLATSIIIGMWESAGIDAPASLLHELGFDREVVQVADLVQALEEEHQRLVSSGHLNSSTISSISGNSFDDAALIVRASLVLHKAEVNALRQAFHQLVEENKKLYADNKEVNHRALLLAQEVDERHNSLENTTRAKIRQLEQRHHESVKELSSQLAFEREQLSHMHSLFESRVHALESEEGKLKAEISRLSQENEEFRMDQENLTKEITDLLEKNIKLNRDIAELEENNRGNDYVDYDDVDECGGYVRKDNGEQVLDLLDRISLLQSENSDLRDKNDELSAEIETLNVELIKFKLKKNATTGGIGENAKGTAFQHSICNGGDTSIIGFHNSAAAVKRRGDSPSKIRLSDENPHRLGKFRRCSDEINDNESDSSSGDWIALHSELGQSIQHSDEMESIVKELLPTTSDEFRTRLDAAVSGTVNMYEETNTLVCGDQDEIRLLRLRIEELELLLSNTKQSIEIPDKTLLLSTEEKNETAIVHSSELSDKAIDQTEKNSEQDEIEYEKLKSRCEELESSLEQMRKEYEDCEDYWQAKLNDERLLYEEEQRTSDEKFTELLKKVAEYEEQFTSGFSGAKLEKDGRLSPIDEKDGLEQQYLDLEADYEQVQLVLTTRTADLEKLRRRLQEMEQMFKYPSEALISSSSRHVETSERSEGRPASSPITYLWTQSTLQQPIRDYQNPNWRPPQSAMVEDKCSTNAVDKLMSDEEITITKLVESMNSTSGAYVTTTASFEQVRPPIQKPTLTPISGSGENVSSNNKKQHRRRCHTNVPELDQQSEASDDSCSDKSTHSARSSVASTHSLQNAMAISEESSGTPGVRINRKHCGLMQVQLKNEIKDLTRERDCLMLELQQLKEAKSIMIARSLGTKSTSHPANQMQKIQNLELKNRHLQSMVKQQQQYTECILHQIWQQQRSEITDLRNRLEAQCVVISDQAARLANNDVLVKDMFAENSQLMSQVQRLEHQCSRANWIQQQHQHQLQQQYSKPNTPTNSHHGLSSIMPGLP
ncbi:uncharacterized protein LOC128727609 [Anopheles nili]|uniref:uncharacterized protein LOC128727609 n=1 Tax=Anopheles nili TaxID=185578 RepID=UPI00237A2515|nr:uncharacterized protein LOC128727609 [Anopheles nili]